MEIAVKSEVDSRILIYPLIKILSKYGTVALYTSNRYCTRLIENELEGGFKNIRVVVNPEADLEAMKESDSWNRSKYDFVIYDNVGPIDYDMLMCILTNRLSESYMQDLLYIIQDEKTHILKFGKAAPIRKDKDKDKPSKGTEETEDDGEDFNKWHTEKSDEDVLQEVIQDSKSTWISFPSFEIIDQMEARHIMPVPDKQLIKELYTLLGETLVVDERNFKKGAEIKDESNSDIGGTDVR